MCKKRERAMVKSPRKAPSPEQKVHTYKVKSRRMRMDVLAQEKVANNHLLAKSNLYVKVP